jgi:ElaB/YqjD/DUF883 family membrane-anchored ribosome-binding protein
MAFLSSPARTERPHAHQDGDRCPTCDQPIPNDRLDEVRDRVAARERALLAEVDARAKEELQAVRAQGEAALQALKGQLAAREEAVRAEARAAVVAEMNARLVEAQTKHADTER